MKREYTILMLICAYLNWRQSKKTPARMHTIGGRTIFREDAKVTSTPHADDIEFGEEPVWSDRPGDPVNEDHHIWVCVPNDRDGQGLADPTDDRPLDYKGEPWDHMWVEIHSIKYDDMLHEDPRQHWKFKELIGKTIRVTVEIID